MQIDVISLLEADTFTALFDLSNDDMAYMVCVGTWLLILWMPLHNVDRRDPITFVTYLCFLQSLGILLFIVIPELLMGRKINYVRDVMLIIVFVSIAGIRWVSGNDKTTKEPISNERVAKLTAKETKV